MIRQIYQFYPANFLMYIRYVYIWNNCRMSCQMQRCLVICHQVSVGDWHYQSFDCTTKDGIYIHSDIDTCDHGQMCKYFGQDMELNELVTMYVGGKPGIKIVVIDRLSFSVPYIYPAKGLNCFDGLTGVTHVGLVIPWDIYLSNLTTELVPSKSLSDNPRWPRLYRWNLCN